VAGYVVSGEAVQAEGERTSVSVLGITPAYLSVVTREVARGQPLTPSDDLVGRRVALLGAGVADTLFGDLDPVGRDLTIAGIRYRVIGVMERVGGQPFGPSPDRQVLVPVSAAQRMFGTDRIDVIFVRAESTATIDATPPCSSGSWPSGTRSPTSPC
jgi:putative ABC transport system permease protein